MTQLGVSNLSGPVRADVTTLIALLTQQAGSAVINRVALLLIRNPGRANLHLTYPQLTQALRQHNLGHSRATNIAGTHHNHAVRQAFKRRK